MQQFYLCRQRRTGIMATRHCRGQGQKECYRGSWSFSLKESGSALGGMVSTFTKKNAVKAIITISETSMVISADVFMIQTSLL